jgi:hypothetical protein
VRKQTTPRKLDVPDRWTAAARGEVHARRLGKPKGELNEIIHMGEDWSKIPNTLFEDATGQLWLAFKKGRKLDHDQIDPDGGFEAVTVEEALDWLQHVSEFSAGYDGDIADVCRIALAELARRPTDLDRVKAAIAEDKKAGFKWRGDRKKTR